MRKIEKLIDKEALLCACDKLFKSKLGEKIELCVKKTITENNMLPLIKGGIAVGFSGGADSVLLTIILQKMQKELKFPLKALHVNHMIRGESADRDEAFSEDFSRALGIEFEALKTDVPKYAEEHKRGIEEAARTVRYEFFAQALDRDKRFNAIATAHNSTDNLETFIFNFMRGSGTRGLCCIAPVRDNVIRPLICVSKEDILKALSDAGIPFVTDETNFSVEYTRNYIRHEIIPKLKRLTPHPEDMSNKAISNLRADSDYITSVADKFYSENEKDGKFEFSVIKDLHPAVLSRVIRLMCQKNSIIPPEKVHIDKIRELLAHGKNFEVDIPGGAKFFLKNSLCYITNENCENKLSPIEYMLKEGFNEIPELNLGIAVSSDENIDFSSNVYKISKKAELRSVIIFGELYVRTKKDGDSYYYGGMTRKVKKLFCDKKIPLNIREKIPVIADEKGIVWIPGFGVRDDSPKNKTHKWITIYEKI